MSQPLMITEHHIPDPVTGGTLSGQAHGDGPITWVAIHPNGLVEWIDDEQDMRETRARLVAERDQHRTRLDELVTEHPELKSRSRRARRTEADLTPAKRSTRRKWEAK